MTEKRLQVKRDGDFYYPIVFEKDFSALSDELKALGKTWRKICIVTDSHVAPLYLETVAAELKKCADVVTFYILPAGEANKNLEQIQGIYERLIQEHFDRKDLLAALGGGVTGDMTGFAAATYLRGIDFIQIPTTLLSQVDSSIGGKTGVDFKQYKNMVGAFHQPRLVYINVSALKTLPDEEFSCGMGEVIKHGLIRDNAYFKWLEENSASILKRDETACTEMIYKSCVIKKTVVENDPKEQGERAVLNMGHTIGHAVEKLKNFTLLHGQCVAVGCVASAYLSRQKGFISAEEFDTVKSVFKRYNLPLFTEDLCAQEILNATKSDKKMESGRIKFVLMDTVGHAVVDTSISDEELLSAINAVLFKKQEASDEQ